MVLLMQLVLSDLSAKVLLYQHIVLSRILRF